MANLNGMFDPNAEAAQDFGAIPSGEYLAQITASDMKPTKQNNGEYLELEYTVIDGEQKGRKIWIRLNLQNKNETAQRIANEQFRSIRDVTGVANPRTSEELHYKPHVIRVEFYARGTADRRGTIRNSDQNEIKAFKAAEGGVPAQQSAAPAAAPATAAPWAQRAA